MYRLYIFLLMSIRKQTKLGHLFNSWCEIRMQSFKIRQNRAFLCNLQMPVMRHPTSQPLWYQWMQEVFFSFTPGMFTEFIIWNISFLISNSYAVLVLQLTWPWDWLSQTAYFLWGHVWRKKYVGDHLLLYMESAYLKIIWLYLVSSKIRTTLGSSLIFKYSSSLEHWTDCLRIISFFDILLQKKRNCDIIFKYIVHQVAWTLDWLSPDSLVSLMSIWA